MDGALRSGETQVKKLLKKTRKEHENVNIKNESTV
jgi:hypothetical protein